MARSPPLPALCGPRSLELVLATSGLTDQYPFGSPQFDISASQSACAVRQYRGYCWLILPQGFCVRPEILSTLLSSTRYNVSKNSITKILNNVGGGGGTFFRSASNFSMPSRWLFFSFLRASISLSNVAASSVNSKFNRVNVGIWSN